MAAAGAIPPLRESVLLAAADAFRRLDDTGMPKLIECANCGAHHAGQILDRLKFAEINDSQVPPSPRLEVRPDQWAAGNRPPNARLAGPSS